MLAINDTFFKILETILLGYSLLSQNIHNRLIQRVWYLFDYK